MSIEGDQGAATSNLINSTADFTEQNVVPLTLYIYI
jgi:hypothetical protein